jgi:hypothetical protein
LSIMMSSIVPRVSPGIVYVGPRDLLGGNQRAGSNFSHFIGHVSLLKLLS